MVLRQIDQIVQIAGRHHHQGIGLGMVPQQRLGGLPDTMQVVEVVGAVVMAVGNGESGKMARPVAG